MWPLIMMVHSCMAICKIWATYFSFWKLLAPQNVKFQTYFEQHYSINRWGATNRCCGVINVKGEIMYFNGGPRCFMIWPWIHIVQLNLWSVNTIGAKKEALTRKQTWPWWETLACPARSLFMWAELLTYEQDSLILG